MTFALIGNQNCGKTTLYNQLTGSRRHVGNFPGVTVDGKAGVIRGTKDVTVVDLPGIYSLRPYTNEEIVTRDFLLNEKPDGIINIVDATNIERNLYLTLQLLEMRIPTVLCLNMMDEVRGNGGTVDTEKMSERLGIPVIPISAAKNEGVDEVIEEALRSARGRRLPEKVDFCPAGPIHRCIHAVSHLIEDHAQSLGICSRFAATKVMEEDTDVIDRLSLDKNELEMIEHSVIEMESEIGLDRHEAMAAMRYDFIESLCRDTVVKCQESREHRRSEKIDAVLTNRYLAIPLFLLIMLTVFTLTFGVIGKLFAGLIELGIGALSDVCVSGLDTLGVNPVVIRLVRDGIFGGVGSVISFIPYIVVLFFFLSILEDTGYMARIAFVMDKPLRKLGLSGRSFVPMLVGFGCTVPAVMSCRTLSSERDRKMTVFLTPFMSCSAKMTVYLFFTAALFPKNVLAQVLVMASLYFGGAAIGLLVIYLSGKTALRGNPMPFVMELPNYRFPSAKSVVLLLWEKAKDFLQKAFTVILAASVIIWFLSGFTPLLNPTEDMSESILGKLGSLLSVIFAPLGFGSWQAVTALISGFSAKEAVVSTLGMLSQDLTEIFPTAASAVSFLVFTLLYTPCVAAIAAVRAELGRSGAWTMVLLQCAVAWAASFAVYRVATLSFGLFDWIVIGAVLAFLLFMILRGRKKKKGCASCDGDCAGCSCRCK